MGEKHLSADVNTSPLLSTGCCHKGPVVCSLCTFVYHLHLKVIVVCIVPRPLVRS